MLVLGCDALTTSTVSHVQTLLVTRARHNEGIEHTAFCNAGWESKKAPARSPVRQSHKSRGTGWVVGK
jgi:hypothetical protein